MSVEWEIRVDIQAVKQLATPLVNRLGGKTSMCLRVQGSLGGEKRETGPSSWGAKGTPRAGEAVWSREEGCLSWMFESVEALREAERRSPKLKLYCYATRGATSEEREPTLENSEPLGTLVLDVHEIRRGESSGWAKLKGPAAPAEVLRAAKARPRLQVPQKHEEAPLAEVEELPAKRLGKGTTLFELCVSLEKAASLAKLVGKELEEASANGRRKYWFSTEVFGVVLQTEQFPARSLDAPPFAVECDWFRLRASAFELATALASPVEVYLCTEGLVVAAGRLSLGPLLPVEAWHPARRDAEFYASEARFRVDVDSRRPMHVFAQPVSPGSLDVFAKLRRVGVSDAEALEKRGPRGWVPPPPPPRDEPEEYDDDDDDEEDEASAVDATTSPFAPPTPARPELSAEPRRWRLVVELLHVTLAAADGPRLRLRYAAEALGQRGVARTATLGTARDASVAVAGKGARAVFEFARLSAADLDALFKNAGALRVELEDDEAPLAVARLDLSAPLIAPETRRYYEARPTALRRVHEANYALGEDRSLRARLTLDEQLEEDEGTKTPPSWSEKVAGKLLVPVDDDDDSTTSGASGGNLASRREVARACAVCGAPSDWATRQTEAAIEAEKRAWEEWRANEEAAWAQRLRRKEQQRLRQLDEEAEKARKAEREEAATHRAEYAKLEAKLRTSLRDVEARERSLSDADAALQRERAVRVSELQLLERRLRDETRHAVEAERRQTKALEKALAAQKNATERADKRATAAEAEFDRWRAAHRRTPEAELAGRLAKAKAEAADLRARLECARAETAEAGADRERLRAQVHRLARALQRARDEANDKARRDLDELRLEYRGREERFVLDGDRRELKNIKAELDNLRQAAVRGETYGEIAKRTAELTLAKAFQRYPPVEPPLVPPSPVEKETKRQPPRIKLVDDDDGDEPPPPPPANEQQQTGAPRDDIDEVFRVINDARATPEPLADDVTYTRLVAERRTLVEDAGYPLDDPVVKDLDRLIQAAHRALDDDDDDDDDDLPQGPSE
ncbi:hypothetical protein CTAYLR_009392 [Chrysophaeum taylorii]|uniref:C2 domain-containing protein n=1 Tax=Chrysophaeum taylorii TaxID=2483200 RepID=A0AAD7XPW7_9STRA|nr:hypothetical protein CTAYLR_009392 [Chrysophaeum taylorii]